MKRYCSVADLKVGNVFLLVGKPYAVFRLPTISTLRRIQLHGDLGPHYQADCIMPSGGKVSVSMPAFHFVELIRG